MAVKKNKVPVATDAEASPVAASKKTSASKPAATAAPGVAPPTSKSSKPAPSAVEPTPAPAPAKGKSKSAVPTAPAPALSSKAGKGAPAVASVTASKAETPKPSPAPKSITPVAPKDTPVVARKAPSPIKLTGRQILFLKQIRDAKDLGYLLAKKAEQKTIDALLDHKLIKKGAKDKGSGHYRYMVSKAGEKHLSSLPASP